MQYKAYVDGSAGPEASKYGYLMYLGDNKEPFASGRFRAPKGTTNNQAEFMALSSLLKHALALMHREEKNNLIVFSDSELLIKGVSGEYNIKKEHLARTLDEIKHNLDALRKMANCEVSIQWIEGSHNPAHRVAYARQPETKKVKSRKSNSTKARKGELDAVMDWGNYADYRLYEEGIYAV